MNDTVVNASRLVAGDVVVMGNSETAEVREIYRTEAKTYVGLFVHKDGSIKEKVYLPGARITIQTK